MSQNGRDLFWLRRTKAWFNPFQMRDSFRVTKQQEDCEVGWCGTSAILFTINKDFFGAGFLWLKEEWRVYRGRSRLHDPLFYCEGSYTDHMYKIWHSQQAKSMGERPVAQLTQKIDAAYLTQQLVPASGLNAFMNSNFKLITDPKEDAGLLVTLAATIDITHDDEAAQQAANARNHNDNDNNGGGNSGSFAEHKSEQKASSGAYGAQKYRRSSNRNRLSLQPHQTKQLMEAELAESFAEQKESGLTEEKEDGFAAEKDGPPDTR